MSGKAEAIRQREGVSVYGPAIFAITGRMERNHGRGYVMPKTPAAARKVQAMECVLCTKHLFDCPECYGLAVTVPYAELERLQLDSMRLAELLAGEVVTEEWWSVVTQRDGRIGFGCGVLPEEAARTSAEKWSGVVESRKVTTITGPWGKEGK